MISKNKIKHLHSLLRKKNRQKFQQVILEGQRLIEESIKAGADIEYFCFTENIKNKISNNSLLNQVQSYMIPDIDLKKISDTKTSQGIIALVSTKKYTNTNLDLLNSNNLVILDGIQDPGNLGTIFRTCVWFGIKSIILTSNCSDPFNLKCVRSGVGAHFYLNQIIIEDSKKVADYLDKKKYSVLVADLKGNDILNIKKQDMWALILGSEAHGINPIFENFPKITIPKTGKVESLNVSVASGIILNQLLNN